MPGSRRNNIGSTRQGIIAVAIALVAAGVLYWGTRSSRASSFSPPCCLRLPLILPVILAAVLWLGQRRTVQPLAKWFWADGRQQLPGLSLALMALLLALAVNVGVGTMVQSFSRTFANWLDTRLGAEVYVNATSDKQGEDIVAWLRQRSEVNAILPAWRTDVTLEGLPVEVLSFANHPTYRESWPLLETLPDVWDKIFQTDSALFSEQLARRLKAQARG